jgi:hypothetical protein
MQGQYRDIHSGKSKGSSESRIGSGTTQGAPEYSGGKDLYMGSDIQGLKKVRRFAGSVPGVPKGFRGSIGGVNLPWGPTWDVGGAPWPIWARRMVHQPA